MIRFWKGLPVILRAVVLGGLAAILGTTPWAIFVKLNSSMAPVVPWAIIPAALYLWVYWRYLRGAWWPQSTSEIRKVYCRANRLSPPVWQSSILAGVLGLVTLVALLRLITRMVRLPAQSTGDLSHIGGMTIFGWLVMGSIVAGIVEESAFRGYMQGPIERKHGPALAILITGTLFGFAHFGHPEVTLFLLPYYIAVATVYGMLAYLTNSIYPSVVLHTVGNILGGLDLLLRGRSEWQTSATPAPLIWEGGPDASFWMACAATLVAGSIAIWAYRNLARVCHQANPDIAPALNSFPDQSR